MSLTLIELQQQQAEWSRRNFPNQKPHQCLLGAMEELGELTHAHLKAEQGIRTNENHHAMRCDAIGDIVIYLAGYCTAHRLHIEECVRNAWNEVKRRDWIKNTAKIDPPCECIHEYTACNKEHTINGIRFYCSLPNGHSGDHVACHGAMHKVASWPNVKEAKESAKADDNTTPPNTLPCPFCGHTELEYNGHYSECGYCHAHGPAVDHDMVEAIRRWNYRWPKICECGDHITLGDDHTYDVSTNKYLCKNCL